MSSLSPQAEAYLSWLKDRGVTCPVAAREPSPAASDAAREPAPMKAVRIAFVSDAPPTTEEKALLDKMIQAMRLGDGETVVLHALSDLPADDAPLASAVVAAAREHVTAALSRTSAEMLVALGAFASRLLFGDRQNFHSVRGRIHGDGRPMLATFHPRDLLRFPANKRLAWTDLQLAMQALGLTP